MSQYSVAALAQLAEQFERLPGIGQKSASRLAYYVLNMPEEDAVRFSEAILDAHRKVCYCKICCNISDSEICPICSDETRDHSMICVVEDPKDVIALERTGEFNAVYHVLHGVLSPMRGITPEMLRIRQLMTRLNNDEVKEVFMATNPTIEGEATSSYLSRLIKPLGIKVTRIAYGIPVGADLEYADEVTLSRAIKTRQEI